MIFPQIPLTMCIGELDALTYLNVLTDFIFIGDVWMSFRTSKLISLLLFTEGTIMQPLPHAQRTSTRSPGNT